MSVRVSAYNGGTLRSKIGTGAIDSLFIVYRAERVFLRAIPWEVQHLIASAKFRNLL